MPKKGYGELEQHIIETMQRDRLVEYHHRLYEVKNVGKPRPQGSGECKTDVYVELNERDSGHRFEVKISVKTDGLQEFQENKVTANRAEAFFGEDWQDIIVKATRSLKSSFESRVLLYASGAYPIKPNSITLGWKLEIANKPRALSVRAPLSDDEIRDFVYKGINQPMNKRDAIVNGRVIRNSGIADYLLVTKIHRIRSSKDVLSQMIAIDTAYIDDTYLIFTANNYRTDVNKADGPRPLAVRIEWRVLDGKLTPIFHYDNPLIYTGEKHMVPYVKKALQILGRKNIIDIDPDNDLSDPHIFQE